MKGDHSGTFTVVCSTTRFCGDRRRRVLNGILVCTSCDEIQIMTTPWEQILDEVPGKASQWWVRPL